MTVCPPARNAQGRSRCSRLRARHESQGCCARRTPRAQSTRTRKGGQSLPAAAACPSASGKLTWQIPPAQRCPLRLLWHTNQAPNGRTKATSPAVPKATRDRPLPSAPSTPLPCPCWVLIFDLPPWAQSLGACSHQISEEDPQHPAIYPPGEPGLRPCSPNTRSIRCSDVVTATIRPESSQKPRGPSTSCSHRP